MKSWQRIYKSVKFRNFMKHFAKHLYEYAIYSELMKDVISLTTLHNYEEFPCKPQYLNLIFWSIWGISYICDWSSDTIEQNFKNVSQYILWARYQNRKVLFCIDAGLMHFQLGKKGVYCVFHQNLISCIWKFYNVLCLLLLIGVRDHFRVIFFLPEFLIFARKVEYV